MKKCQFPTLLYITQFSAEIDVLEVRRKELEKELVEAKLNRDMVFPQNLDKVRVQDSEKYNELKLNLEGNIQV